MQKYFRIIFKEKKFVPILNSFAKSSNTLIQQKMIEQQIFALKSFYSKRIESDFVSRT